MLFSCNTKKRFCNDLRELSHKVYAKYVELSQLTKLFSVCHRVWNAFKDIY